MKQLLRYLTVLTAVFVFAASAFGGGKVTLAPPTISCAAGATGASIDVIVTAGATGAPAGVSIHWMLRSEYEQYGWSGQGGSYCEGSFSGNAAGHYYRLDPGESVTISLGDRPFDRAGASSPCEGNALECGQAYAFRSFAHANSSSRKSAWSATTFCSTMNCGGGGGDDEEQFGCTVTQDSWLESGPTGAGEDLWPGDGLTLGNVFYTELQIESILATPAGGNGLIALAHQLITAKLNIANGASSVSVLSSIMAGDSLIGNLVVPPVGSAMLTTTSTASVTASLRSYNEGVIGPGSCE